MQTFVKGSEAKWIELGGGMRRRILAYNGEMCSPASSPTTSRASSA